MELVGGAEVFPSPLLVRKVTWKCVILQELNRGLDGGMTILHHFL